MENPFSSRKCDVGKLTVETGVLHIGAAAEYARERILAVDESAERAILHKVPNAVQVGGAQACPVELLLTPRTRGLEAVRRETVVAWAQVA